MTVKFAAAGVAAVAAIAAAAAGVTSVASGIASPNSLALQVQPVAVGAPLPLDPPPATDLPTVSQLTTIMVNLSNPDVSYKPKEGLVEGGINPGEGHGLDHELKKGSRNGDFPLSFEVSNIQPAGPDRASADVAISGPKLPAPVTKNLTFVNQDGWMLTRDSAMELVQAATAR
jgi:hypothetical protein